MKTLRLIMPGAPGSLMGNDFYFRLPSLGLLRVAALTPPDWHVVIADEKVERLDLAADADLVGITAVTTTVQRAYEIADHYRGRGIKVVMGGMHASCLPEEALAHCDAVVIGEAEGLWPAVLADFAAGALRRRYQHQDPLPILDKLPISDWNLYAGKGYLPVHFLETTRGCPLDCEFCAVTSAFGGRYRNRPVPEVAAEIRGLKPFGGVLTLKNCVFFVDDNIVGNRAHARELFAQIAEYKLKWFGQASVNIANDTELLKAAKASGCMGLFMGFESLSPETVAAAGKKVNQPSQYRQVVQKLHDHGIGVMSSFVFGFDTDDPSVFDRTLEFVIEAKVEMAYFSILTPYPGTRLYQRMEAENRILTRDWSRYDSQQVVCRPAKLTVDQLMEGYHRTLSGFYSWSSIFKRLWGTTAYKNFFYPTNLGFRSSYRKQAAQWQKAEN